MSVAASRPRTCELAPVEPGIGEPASVEPAAGTGRLMDLETMLQRLERELCGGSTLDAYLLAAGIAQIVDDYLHASTHPFGDAARYLHGGETLPIRLAGRTAAAIDAAGRSARRRRASFRGALRWRAQLDVLLSALAREQVNALVRAGPSACTEAAASTPGLVPLTEQTVPRLPDPRPLPLALREAVGKLPACFSHCDQRVADVLLLARRFAIRRPDRGRRLLVVGVRTSGSYLAPLCAASLAAIGYRRVQAATVRPGHRLLRSERALVGALAREDGLALVLDDPPVTGSSVRRAAAELQRAGLSDASIVLALATAGPAELPAALRGFEAVLLAGDEWSVCSDLVPAAVRRTLQALAPAGRRVVAVRPVPLPVPAQARGHHRALFEVRTQDSVSGPQRRLVLAEGVGSGYLAAHRIAAPELVARFSPPVLGLRDGLLYREWLPSSRRLGASAPAEEEQLARVLAEYVSQRRSALPCERDLSLRMGDEVTAWRVASQILSAGFGRGWPLARVLLTDRAVRRLLRVRQASVVDGNTDLAQWFRREGPNLALAKPDVGEDRFSNLAAACFDSAFDLAGVTARGASRRLPGLLRTAFADLTGEAVDEERWLLYELVHLWGRERTQPAEAAELRRAGARAVQRYFADVYLDGIATAADGPLCVLDLDGVLEGAQFGFPALTPMAALALRSLLAHGYRPVLATGRSLDEAAERCLSYGLTGAVAEYGSVTFRAADGDVQSLLCERETAALQRLRAFLHGLGGVALDPSYGHAIRAFDVRGKRGRSGGRGPLPARQAAEAIALAGGGIEAIVGDGQTDFVASTIDKGSGLRALAAALGCPQARPCALAVGDSAADLPLAQLAALACAPRHADPALARGGFQIMRSPYQAGLAQAVGRLLGHAPGGCARCRLPPGTPERALTRSLLGIAEEGRAGIVKRGLELLWRAR